MKYTLRAVRPTGSPMPPDSYAEFEIRLTSPAVSGGKFVDAGPVMVQLPPSGVAEVELIPSRDLETTDGRSPRYLVTQRWRNASGELIPCGYSEWGPLWLAPREGDLCAMLTNDSPRPGLVEVSAGTTYLDGSRRPVADFVGLWIDSSKEPMVLMVPEGGNKNG